MHVLLCFVVFFNRREASNCRDASNSIDTINWSNSMNTTNSRVNSSEENLLVYFMAATDNKNVMDADSSVQYSQ